MNDLRTAAQQALEFVTSERWGTTPYMDVCVYEDAARLREALRAALAQQDAPTQEPVAWQCREHGDSEWFDCGKESYGINPRRYTYRALYTAPPKAEPVEPVATLTAQRDDLLQAVKKIRSFTVDEAMVYAAMIDINSVASRAIKAAEAKE